MKIRVIKTGSGARAVQVIKYQNNKRIVLKHIGSAHTDQEVMVKPSEYQLTKAI